VIVQSTIDLAHNLGLTVIAEASRATRPGAACGRWDATSHRAG
jgi:hypothetical protein